MRSQPGFPAGIPGAAVDTPHASVDTPGARAGIAGAGDVLRVAGTHPRPPAGVSSLTGGAPAAPLGGAPPPLPEPPALDTYH